MKRNHSHCMTWEILWYTNFKSSWKLKKRNTEKFLQKTNMLSLKYKHTTWNKINSILEFDKHKLNFFGLTGLLVIFSVINLWRHYTIKASPSSPLLTPTIAISGTNRDAFDEANVQWQRRRCAFRMIHHLHTACSFRHPTKEAPQADGPPAMSQRGGSVVLENSTQAK